MERRGPAEGSLQEAGLSETSVARIMVLFSLGLVVGNWIGRRFGDRSLSGTLLVALAAKAAVLFVVWLGVGSSVVASISAFLVSSFGSATVSPIQKLDMDRAGRAGAPTMVATSMFNLGNAIGAKAGGATIAAGFGLASPNWASALLSRMGLGVEVVAWLMTGRSYFAVPVEYAWRSTAHRARRAGQVDGEMPTIRFSPDDCWVS